MTIASEITRLQNSKSDIKTAIEGKGVTVGDELKLDGYSACIDKITTGGGYCIRYYVGGGGGGGGMGSCRDGGSGGGAGALVSGIKETSGGLAIHVGSGGAMGASGGSSCIEGKGLGIVAEGGGGGTSSRTCNNCLRGGSSRANTTIRLGGLNCSYAGGGGAGIYGAGKNAPSAYCGGAGGAGTSVCLGPGTYSIGGGGGGGAAYTCTYGGAGCCGGGAGGGCKTQGSDATGYSSGGGGGGGYNSGEGCVFGGAGHSGFVRLSYKADGSDGISNGVGGAKYLVGDYCYHFFESDGTFTPLDGCYVDVLIVGPGGGGYCENAGGGGEVIYKTLKTGSSITVCAGIATCSWLTACYSCLTIDSDTILARGGCRGDWHLVSHSGNGYGNTCGEYLTDEGGGGAGGPGVGCNGGPGLCGYGGGGAAYCGTATCGGGTYRGNATNCGGGGGQTDSTSTGAGGGGLVEICYPADGGYGFTTATGGTVTTRTVYGTTFCVHRFLAGCSATFTITG